MTEDCGVLGWFGFALRWWLLFGVINVGEFGELFGYGMAIAFSEIIIVLNLTYFSLIRFIFFFVMIQNPFPPGVFFLHSSTVAAIILLY